MILQDELVVDNFAGGGGASSGMYNGLKRHVDIAINHDPDAISMHKLNHPETKHYCESLIDVDPVEVTRGRPVGLAWFSPDCTHFAKARGSKPVDKNIRGLAWVVVNWASLVNMRVFMLENVEEFKTWGPVGPNGHPIKERAGETFEGFLSILTDGIDPSHPALGEVMGMFPDLDVTPLINGLGYKIEHRILRACDYGAPTIRKRLFMIGRKDDKPIVWPDVTHLSPALIKERGDNMLNEDGVEIKKWKTAADIMDWSVPVKSIFGRKRPLVPKTMERIAKGIWKYVINTDKPYLVPQLANIPFLTEHANGSSQRVFDIQEPLRTQCAQVKGGHFALVSAMIARQFGNSVGHSIEDPLVTSHMIKFKGNNYGAPVDEPMHTVTSVGYIGEVRAFLMQYYGTLNVSSMDEPLRTVTSKARLGLVTVRGVDYQIVDIGMRMLTPYELFQAQGFSKGYIIDVDEHGNRTTIKNQVARCGNAVPPPVSEALVKANMEV